MKEKEDWVKDITQLLHVVHAPHVVNEPLLGSDTVKVASTEGWLMKQGDIVKSWKRRYFRLKGDTLFYFVNEKATEPRGYVQITDGYFVIPTPSNEFPDIKFGITIAHPRKRTYYVAAENQQEYQHWLVELQKKCNGTSMK